MGQPESNRTEAVAVATFPDGVLNVRKERGCTSHDVVARLRRLLGGAKVGHAGTLDPEATGVLPVLVGKATRIAEFLSQWDKEYRAVLRLGETTDTQDATGTVIVSRPVGMVTDEMVQGVLPRFVGPLLQVPPMYSAVKIGGVPLYKAARAGRTVEREARTITVHAIKLLGIEGRNVTLRIACSKGTYIRTLCAEIGEALEWGGHMVSLERERVGLLNLRNARTVEEIGVFVSQGRLGEAMQSIDEILENMPRLEFGAADAIRVLHGVPIPLSSVVSVAAGDGGGFPVGQIVRLKDSTGCLLGLGRILDAGPLGFRGQEQPGRTVRVLKVFAATEGRG